MTSQTHRCVPPYSAASVVAKLTAGLSALISDRLRVLASDETPGVSDQGMVGLIDAILALGELPPRLVADLRRYRDLFAGLAVDWRP